MGLLKVLRNDTEGDELYRSDLTQHLDLCVSYPLHLFLCFHHCHSHNHCFQRCLLNTIVFIASSLTSSSSTPLGVLINTTLASLHRRQVFQFLIRTAHGRSRPLVCVSLVRIGHGRSCPLVFVSPMRTAQGRSCPLVFVSPVRTVHGRSCPLVLQFLMRTTHGRSRSLVFHSPVRTAHGQPLLNLLRFSLSPHRYTTLPKRRP